MSLRDEIRTRNKLQFTGCEPDFTEWLPVESVRFCFRRMKVLLCCCEVTKPNECAVCVLIKRRLSELEEKR